MTDKLKVVAWRAPGNSYPAQAVTFDNADAQRWPHIYSEPLVLQSEAQAALDAALERAADLERDRDLEKKMRKDSDDHATDLAERVKVLEADARRYRWLRDGKNHGNRYPHLTQYPYQPDLDKVAIPQMIVDFRRRPENIDAAIDAAIDSAATAGKGTTE